MKELALSDESIAMRFILKLHRTQHVYAHCMCDGMLIVNLICISENDRTIVKLAEISWK